MQEKTQEVHNLMLVFFLYKCKPKTNQIRKICDICSNIKKFKKKNIHD